MGIASATATGLEGNVSVAVSRTLLGCAKAVARPRASALGGAGAFVSVDPRQLTERVIGRLRARADAKCVDLMVHCTCHAVRVDPQAFSDALYELLDNAVRTTRRGYPVIVDIRDTDDGDVLWQVQDAGEGMTNQTLAQLGQAPCASPPEAPGLGVSRAWAVVEDHGGMLRFESARRVGTTASIWLPGRAT